MPTRRTPTCRTLVAAALGGALTFVPTPAASAATHWSVALAASSHGEAHAQARPAAPANPTATCSGSSLTIVVNWSAVTHAGTYTVYQATSSSSGPYSAVATGLTTTTWTSGTLGTGTYWYKVSATVGTTWTSPQSAATASHTITTDCT